MSTEEAFQALDRLLDLIDELEMDHHSKYIRGEEFFESIRGSASDMRETIERLEQVTERQEVAIENWTDGVEKWFR